MSIMNGIYHEEMDECIVVYINNILVYAKNVLDYVWDLRRILEN